MPKRLKSMRAYEQYMAAMQAALMHPYIEKRCLSVGSARRFRQMCYQVRTMFRNQNGGASPWDDIVITLDHADPKTVRLVMDRTKDFLFTPTGPLDTSTITLPTLEEETPFLTEDDVRYILEEDPGAKIPAHIRVIPSDVEIERGPGMPAISSTDDPFGGVE